MQITKIETNFKRHLYWKETRHKFNGKLGNTEKGLINLYPDEKAQEILGFGGAFTESSGYNLTRVSQEISEAIMQDYFSENGLNYSFCRTPIGSTDFGLESYSYLRKAKMEEFSVEHDETYVIPMLKKALKLRTDLRLLASPWSPPAFLKNNKRLIGGGKLLPRNYDFYAEYLAKYVLEYEKKGIKIEYITIQNEPNATQVWESCLFSAEEEADFAKNFLKPKFEKYGIQTKILAWDHNKERLFSRAKTIYAVAPEAVSGMALHWYSGDYFEEIELTRKKFPSKLIIHTEGCTGFSHFREADEVKNAEIYGHDMMGDLNAGVNAFVDWNMVLDHKGGPNHKFNYCNAPIMLNKENTGYSKNLTYYYIGQFSKFIKPGARKIGFSRFTTDVEGTAFQNGDGSIVVVLLNRNDWNQEFTLNLNGVTFHDNLDSHAIVTLVMK